LQSIGRPPPVADVAHDGVATTVFVLDAFDRNDPIPSALGHRSARRVQRLVLLVREEAGAPFLRGIAGEVCLFRMEMPGSRLRPRHDTAGAPPSHPPIRDRRNCRPDRSFATRCGGGDVTGGFWSSEA